MKSGFQRVETSVLRRTTASPKDYVSENLMSSDLKRLVPFIFVASVQLVLLTFALIVSGSSRFTGQNKASSLALPWEVKGKVRQFFSLGS
jgi:hypothetical protein